MLTTEIDDAPDLSVSRHCTKSTKEAVHCSIRELSRLIHRVVRKGKRGERVQGVYASKVSDEPTLGAVMVWPLMSRAAPNETLTPGRSAWV